MGLKPYDRTIKQIFTNTEYDIDFYQREYKWSDNLPYKPVISLIGDIYHPFEKEYNATLDIKPENIQKFEWYFLNSFMTNKDGKKYIVDGQQRLTTLTLINISLYHLAIQFKINNSLIDTLKSSVYGAHDYGKTYWVGFGDRDMALEDLLKNNLQYKRKPGNISEKNIYENYKIIHKFLTQELTTLHKLNTFILYYRERIYLVEIEVDKSKDVAMVFEVINDRGIPLKAHEILKGKLISQIDKADNSKYLAIWEEKTNKLEEISEDETDEFFFYFLRARYCVKTDEYRAIDHEKYHKTIFLDSLNQKLKLKSDPIRVKKFIEDEFLYYADLYLEIIKYYDEYHEEYKHIYFNQINDMHAQFMLIMSAVQLYDADRDEKIKLVAKLLDKLFVVLRLTDSYRSNEFNNLAMSICTEIRNKNTDEIEVIFEKRLLEFVRKAKSRMGLQSAFRYELFKDRNYTEFGPKFLRYIFARVENYVAELSNLPAYGSYDQLVLQAKGKMVFHIDHIITNNSKNIKLFKSEDEFNEQRNRLGDLVLLKGSDNESSNDELYKEKLKTYSVKGTRYSQTLTKGFYKSNPTFLKNIKKLNLNFVAYDSYTKTEIEARHRLLFEIIKIIWDL